MELQYRKATLDDAHRVFHIVRHTKDVIYHDYYTQEVVEYVDRYYTFEIIKSDIEQGRTCVLVKDGKIIGTGSRVDNHIMRVYVLPEFQGQGLGSAIMDELEEEIFESYNECVLEASLPACIFYENRDYKTVKHVKENIGDGKCMVYEIMRKTRYSSIIGFVVTVTVDRPIGSVHPKHTSIMIFSIRSTTAILWVSRLPTTSGRTRIFSAWTSQSKALQARSSRSFTVSTM